jgi:hypothetical protein
MLGTQKKPRAKAGLVGVGNAPTRGVMTLSYPTETRQRGTLARGLSDRVPAYCVATARALRYPTSRKQAKK